MVSQDILQNIDNHGAVQLVGDDKLRQSILNDDYPHDEDALKRLAMAYEMAAIEGMADFINNTGNLGKQFVGGSRRAFELNCKVNVSNSSDPEFIFYLLHLSSLAYCSDSEADLKHVYDELSEKIEFLLSKEENDWDKRILLCLFACWVKLFRKNSLDELHHILDSIAQLRKDQTKYEVKFLNTGSNVESHSKAMRLMSLYHWAKATELLALYRLQEEPADVKARLDKHFNLAIKLGAKGGDAQLEVLLHWLHASASKMVNDLIC